MSLTRSTPSRTPKLWRDLLRALEEAAEVIDFDLPIGESHPKDCDHCQRARAASVVARAVLKKARGE